MTDEAPETVRPLTPKEIRELLTMTANHVGCSVAMCRDMKLRATLTRYCDLAEMLEDVPEVALPGDLTPQMHDEDCDHDDPIGLAICEMDTAVGNAELIATEDDEVAAQIGAAWRKLKGALEATWICDLHPEGCAQTDIAAAIEAQATGYGGVEHQNQRAIAADGSTLMVLAEMRRNPATHINFDWLCTNCQTVNHVALAIDGEPVSPQCMNCRLITGGVIVRHGETFTAHDEITIVATDTADHEVTGEVADLMSALRQSLAGKKS